MAPPPKMGASFTPAQIKQLGDAFDLAVREASATGTPLATIPALELRRQLACLVLAEARNGPICSSRISKRVLEGLRLMTMENDLIAKIWPDHWSRSIRQGLNSIGAKTNVG